MKTLTVYSSGEPSVGISPIYCEVEVPDWHGDKEIRESTFHLIREAYKEILDDERVVIWTEEDLREDSQ